MFNTRNKSGISAHPRIILYLMNVEGKLFKKMLEEDCNLLTMSSYNAPKDAGTLELRICGISCQVYKKAAQFVNDIFRYAHQFRTYKSTRAGAGCSKPV